MKLIFVSFAMGGAFLATAAIAGPGDTANVVFKNINGEQSGKATLIEQVDGILINGRVGDEVSLGLHGIHIHAVGKCEPPFDSAGGHFNPAAKKHGHDNPDGHHAGDLPNIDVKEDRLFEIKANGLALDRSENGLVDSDGAAIVIHAGPDDNKSDPAGTSGSRILCGVIELSN